MKFLNRLFETSRARASADAVEAPAPARPIYAVGDIHGRADLLDALLRRIDQHIVENGLEGCQLVFLGDYVDRGERSAEVLERLVSLSTGTGGNVICLKGNHESLMQDFLSRPERNGRRWLRYGGLQTLASFGIFDVTETADSATLARAAAELREKMPEGMTSWLDTLPLCHVSGNMGFVHADAAPELALQAQGESTLLWGQVESRRKSRADGLWIVHGHTVVETPVLRAGRISVDTGAYFSNTLTAAVLSADRDVEFITSKS